MASRLMVGMAVATSLCVEGARVLKKRAAATQETKFIAGIPILNYHLAQPSLVAEDGSAGSHDWTVVVNAGTTDEQVKHLCEMGDCKYAGHPSEGGMPFYEVRATEEELQLLLEQAVGIAKFVEPDSEVRLAPEAEETTASPWGLDRIGTSARAGKGKGTHIYVLDTGIRKTHSDFGGRVVPTLDMSRTLKRCRSWSPLPCAGDAQGHGTHCAGTAAGASYGVASEATIHAVKVLSDQGGGQWSWSYEALDFLATEGERPAVASMSLGGRGQQNAMKVAVDAAVEAGVTVVVSAGNKNTDSCTQTPAFIPSAITVGSTDSTDSRSSFSSYGPCTKIWAPGSAILSAGHTGDDATRTLSGTSMACPHVSGASALLLEKDHSMSPAKVLAALLANAEADAISDLKDGDTNKLLQVAGSR